MAWHVTFLTELYHQWGDKTLYLKVLNVQESQKTWLP